ncbi:MAG: hypothetical protein J6M47_03040 [Clostridia bacterium]|nr:hypothetical protein [Clostridia bacterium]
MKKSMKTAALLAALLAMILVCAVAAADGAGVWYSSELFGYGQFAQYAGEYDGYVNVDDLGSEYGTSPYVTVISKSASIWSEPRTNSKKVASAANAESMDCQTYDGYNYIMEDGFYAVTYKGKDGWINQDYVVLDAMEITLMESNVPAYIAPDAASKKVGSLSKQTAYRVIGIYDDFYIVNLRGAAAAFIPMSAKHYDSSFTFAYRSAGPRGTITLTRKASLRTGPAESYGEIRKLNAGKQLEVYDIINGWYLVEDTESGCWAFIDGEDAYDDCFDFDEMGNG